jgi:Cu/Ag efflux protein CusF
MSIRLFALALLLALASFSGASPNVADAASPVPLGIDLGASGPVTPMPQTVAMPTSHPPTAAPRQGAQMAHDGQNDVHATGTVNSVDPAAHKLNISHQPIPAIGWPSMTMDFAVAPTVNLAGVKPGAKVNFSMVRQPDGMYAIQSIAPAGGSP